jgi:hypothetical protein
VAGEDRSAVEAMRRSPRDGFRVPLRQVARSAGHRLRRDRAPPRSGLLRPARLGGAIGQLRPDRPGTGSARALVFARTLADQSSRRLRADLLERLDVRIPDARSSDADLSGHAAPRYGQGRCVEADRIRRRAWRSLGNLGIVLQRGRREAGVPIPGVRRARTGAQARLGRRSGHCSVRDAVGFRGGATGVLPQPASARGERLSGALRVLRGRGLHAFASRAEERARDRTHVHGTPPGHGPGGARQPVERSPDAAPIHGRSPDARDGTAPAGADPQVGDDADRADASRRAGSARRLAGRAVKAAGIQRARHADARGKPVVQRPVPRHDDPCRRRVRPMARPGRHALAGGRHARLVGYVRVSARPRFGTLLVGRPSANAAQGRSVRSGLRAGARGISPPRSRDRGVHRARGLAGGRRRDPSRHADEPLATSSLHRDHELRRSRLGAAERRSGASLLQQSVRDDRGARRPAGDPVLSSQAEP